MQIALVAGQDQIFEVIRAAMFARVDVFDERVSQCLCAIAARPELPPRLGCELTRY